MAKPGVKIPLLLFMSEIKKQSYTGEFNFSKFGNNGINPLHSPSRYCWFDSRLDNESCYENVELPIAVGAVGFIGPQYRGHSR